ncbi:MAG: hypothetical protein CMN74_07600 [Sphingorhabdus sp.]|nr:hypothetical protein [Sphingorhabdus sp.]|tara:strand:- start:147 stop:797 length:651 start_codon:yes stop_codon:yes gene_type:complete
MAKRPVFVPNRTGSKLVTEVPVEFTWHPGMAASQKKKNVSALHEAAARNRGLPYILEISSKSERKAGTRLSAFHLPLCNDGYEAPLECWFQGSKVFQDGGPYTDLYHVSPREAKRDPRLRESGNLIAFRFEGRDYPLSPATAFYDWIYIRALAPHSEWAQKLERFDAFSDIEFNPAKSINCQARSCATFVALCWRDEVRACAEDFDYFVSLQSQSV